MNESQPTPSPDSSSPKDQSPKAQSPKLKSPETRSPETRSPETKSLETSRDPAGDELGGAVRSRLHSSMDALSIAPPRAAEAQALLSRAQRTHQRRQRRERAVVGIAVVVLLLGAVVGLARVRDDGTRGVATGATPPGSEPVGSAVPPPTTVVVPVPVPVPTAPGPTTGATRPGTSVGTAVPPPNVSPIVQVTPSPDGVPHLILPGWTTTRFATAASDNGWPGGFPYVEYQYAKADQRLQISFYAESDYDTRADERREQVAVRGTTGRMLDYGGGRYRVNFVEQGRTWEADGGPFASREELLAVLATIHGGDDAAWKASLPANAVTSDERAQTVDEMLYLVPIPPGFDIEALRTKDQPDNAYDLGASVLGSVTCAWIRHWLDASPDDLMRPQAVAALGSVSSWPALQAMRAEGEYPQVLEQYAQRAVRRDRAGLEGYEAALGC